MEELFVVENKKMKIEFKMGEISISEIQNIYDFFCDKGLEWETKKIKIEEGKE